MHVCGERALLAYAGPGLQMLQKLPEASRMLGAPAVEGAGGWACSHPGCPYTSLSLLRSFGAALGPR